MLLAHRLASAADISRPSGASVAFCCVPSPGCAADEEEEANELGPIGVLAYGTEEALTLLGVGGGRLVSMSESVARSSLFPTNKSERFGDASARASLRNGCSAEKVLCDVIS